MANAVKYGALGTNTTVINGDATTPTLKNLSNNARKLGSEIDRTGSGNREQEGLFELYVRGASAFSSGGYVALYLVKAQDGTNYEDGDDSTDPPASAWVANIPLRAVSTQQRISMIVPIPPCKFKPLLINKGGQAFTNTDNENILKYRLYDANEVQ